MQAPPQKVWLLIHPATDFVFCRVASMGTTAGAKTSRPCPLPATTGLGTENLDVPDVDLQCAPYTTFHTLHWQSRILPCASRDLYLDKRAPWMQILTL